MTPKFECEVTPGDVVKVKYGENNGEVFAEVAASRLFWALGFLSRPDVSGSGDVSELSSGSPSRE